MKAVDEYFAELEPLVNRPLSRMQLEEQPEPADWLRAHCVPTLSDTTPQFSSNVLNDVMVGVKRYALSLRSQVRVRLR